MEKKPFKMHWFFTFKLYLYILTLSHLIQIILLINNTLSADFLMNISWLIFNSSLLIIINNKSKKSIPLIKIMLALRVIYDSFNLFSNIFYFLLLGMNLAWLNYFFLAKRFKSLQREIKDSETEKNEILKSIKKDFFKYFKKMSAPKNKEVAFKISSAAILLLLIIISLSMLSKNSILKSEISSLNETIFELSQNNSMLLSNYIMANSELIEIQEIYENLQNEHESLNYSYNILSQSIDEKFREIDDYFDKISELSQWIKTNANFDNSTWEPQRPAGYIMNISDAYTSFENAKSEIYLKCLYEQIAYSKIQSGCLFLTNDKYLKLSYKADRVTSEKIDRMQSLKDFMINRGGDCEDYSLFFKAQINYLINASKSQNIIIEAHYFGDKINDPHGFIQRHSNEYFLSKDNYWHYSNVNIIEFGEFIYPIIVCGNMFDLNSGELAGHCMIALTQSRINSSKDLTLLDKAPLIEPQTGIYEGLINHASSGIYMKSNNSASASFIDWVITDDDFYIYFNEKSQWQSNNEFYSLLKSIKESINIP